MWRAFMRRIRFDLYSAGQLNTAPRADGTGRRTSKTGRIGRDTPRLYVLYSDVFSGHLHTNSAPQPYSRKGFQICIQCIQRIPTPPVFWLLSPFRAGIHEYAEYNPPRPDQDSPPRLRRNRDHPRTPHSASDLYSAAFVNTRSDQKQDGR